MEFLRQSSRQTPSTKKLRKQAIAESPTAAQVCHQVKRYLPDADVFYSLAKRSLERHAELESIAPDLNDVVEQSAHSGHWKSRGKQSHVTKLYQHLQIILKSVFVLQNNKRELK